MKARFESGSSHLSFNTLSSRRFQGGFDRIKLHRPTMAATPTDFMVMALNQ
jgi:hypothetical protein